MEGNIIKAEKLSDVQYLKNYDEHIGLLYEEAKASYIDAPIQTLVSLRSIVELICNQLIDEYSLFKGSDLASIISELQNKRVLKSYVIKYMRSIKDDGNKAAHKHQYKISMDQYREMSADSTRTFCSLIQALNCELLNNFSSFSFDPTVASYLEKLSYKALIDNDAEAKFKVGMALIEQVITIWNSPKDTNTLILSEDGKIGRGVKLIKDAALHRWPDAMFEYALMLLSGEYIDQSIEEAMKYFYHAADLEHTQAKAYFGCIALEKNYIEDIPLALKFLNEAAAEQNPYALTKLAELYANGEHVELDVNKSTELLEKAVSQDFPLAYYQLALNKWKDREFDSTVELLKKSKAFGYGSASLLLARIYAATTGYQEQALAEYRDYKEFDHVDFSDHLEATLEYEQYNYSLNTDNFQALKKYLLFLASYYRQEKSTKDLAPQIEEMTPPLLKKYQQMLSDNYQAGDTDLFLQFLPSAKPYKSIDEVMANTKKVSENQSLVGNYFYGGEASNKKQLVQLRKAETLKLQETNKKRKDKAKRRQKNKRKKR